MRPPSNTDRKELLRVAGLSAARGPRDRRLRMPPRRYRKIWSEWPDLNRRPFVPQTNALPGCATQRLRGLSSRLGQRWQPSGGCHRGTRRHAADGPGVEQNRLEGVVGKRLRQPRAIAVPVFHAVPRAAGREYEWNAARREDVGDLEGTSVGQPQVEHGTIDVRDLGNLPSRRARRANVNVANAEFPY